VFSVAPFVVLAGMVALYALRRAGRTRRWAPNGAGVALMILSFALGPGVVVNLVLKDHAHRPRPVHVREFGGDEDFRPVLRFDGTCPRNCSFVSGEGSAAFWTLAPALLAPAPVRVAAIAAALVYGVATSLLRMAFGGHFLSDTILAGLVTWLVIVLCWRGIVRFAGRAPGAMPDEPSHDAQDRR
jgi:membrane-associated PAP2 superfamily phosphatase